MRKLLISCVLCVPLLASAQDSWTGADKAKHFGVSFGLGAFTEATMPKLPFAAKFAIAIGPGLGKELTDQKFSTKDLVWDAIGVYSGMSFTHLLVRKNFIGYKGEF